MMYTLSLIDARLSANYCTSIGNLISWSIVYISLKTLMTVPNYLYIIKYGTYRKKNVNNVQSGAAWGAIETPWPSIKI